MRKDALNGKRLLIVEDEYLVASDLSIILEGAGARVFGPVSDLERALEIASTMQIGFDAAILDINLNGEMAYPVATLLRESNFPFIFLTGYGYDAMPEQFRDAPCMLKPFEEERLVRLLASIT
ncbi:response regulator [Agrobacterium tumefaciens]|uniref:response regulator n=1 Tax=Agrobacterium tumefaciens TaxID=358 RepID=UPI00384FC27F